MKHLGISGGGTKIAGLFGAAEAIIYNQGYQPDIISGISAGAILSVPLALGKREEIKRMVLNINLDTFFSTPPVDRNGKIRVINALMKVLFKKNYLGVQKNLEKTLSTIVSEQEFQAYKDSPAYAICIVGTVDFYTGKRFYINLKNVSYDHFLKFVNASASIPIFTPGISFDIPIVDFEGESSTYNKILLYDGGVRDHSPSQKILESNAFSITETCTLFSRPEDIRETIEAKTFHPHNLLSILERFTQITNAEVSKNDAFQEAQIIIAKNIVNHGTFYLPKIMQGVYDVNKERLKMLYEASQTLITDETWKNA